MVFQLQKDITKVEAKNVCDLKADMLHYSYDDYIHMIRTTEKFIKRGAILAHEEGKKATVLIQLFMVWGFYLKALILKRREHFMELMDGMWQYFSI